MDALVIDVVAATCLVFMALADTSEHHNALNHERRATYWIAFGAAYAYGVLLVLLPADVYLVELLFWIAYNVLRLWRPRWCAPAAALVWWASEHCAFRIAAATPLLLHSVFYTLFINWWFNRL